MKILLTRSMLPADIQYLRDGLDREISGQYEFLIPAEFTEDALCAMAVDADVFLGPFVTRKMIDSAPRLRLIQVPWTGMDTFDFSSVQGVTVPVCNTHSNADAVAEIAVAIVLDLLKKVSYHDRKMRAGDWNRGQTPLNLKSRMLNRQTVCVLGFGHIGSKIGQLMSAFGAKIIAVDDHASQPEIASAIFSSGAVREALAQADVVICTLPLTETTRGLMDKDLLSAMNPGAVLVNMSRAAVVEEDALWDALTVGSVGGFGADVWWNAPKRGESQSYPSARHPFWTLENVVMSPHRAGFTEGCLPHLDGAIENLIALSKGGKLSGLVDVARGY